MNFRYCVFGLWFISFGIVKNSTELLGCWVVLRKVEFLHLTVAWLVLGFCFSVRWLFFSFDVFLTMFFASLIAVGFGFVVHELSHKFTAQRFGCRAEFRMWQWGLMMALLFAFISGGRFIFAAPGAVYILPKVRPIGWGYEISQKENGLISLSGPLANVVVAAVFFPLIGFEGFLGLVGNLGFIINLWLAGFNLLPLAGLDGQKVFVWSRLVWAVFTIPIWLLTVFQLFM